MSGDWMKVELELPDKPEVFRIASLLKLDPDTVTGKLLRVWAWFDKHTEDGNADSVTYALVDRISGVSGFGEAMMFAGWLDQLDHGIRVPKFDRHNGKTAKNRALTAKRVANSKDKSNAKGNAPIVTTALPREEKRREEEKIEARARPDGPSVADLLTGVNPVVVADFTAIRQAKRSPITPTAVLGIQREANKAGMTLEAALTMACERGWQGFKADWLKDANAPREPAALPRLRT